ncbi:MAG: response regulator [Patescibacteria group bacterium]
MPIEERKKYKVFFIEDEPGIVELYEAAFSGSGFEIKSVTNGTDALTEITLFKKGREKKPDVIVSDILLPDISGLEILKEIRNSHEFDQIPVIMLTNYGTNEIKQTIAKTPNARHVLKLDTTPYVFVSEVRKMMDLRSA